MGIGGRPNIDRMEKLRNVKGLIKALTYQDREGDKRWEESIQWEAARALGNLGNQKAVGPLIDALHSDN